MRRALQLLSLVVGLAILVAPMTEMIRPWIEEAPLVGVVEEAKRPALHVRDVLSESFQKRFTAWFDLHYGFRPTATRVDNSLDYYLFHEVRPNRWVRVGRNDVLFYPEQLAAYNRQGNPARYVQAFARAARAASEGLAARGKVLVLMLIPAKTSCYRDTLGWRLSLPLDPDRPCDVNVYRPFVEALTREGVPLVDGRALLMDRLKLDRELIYTPTGRHLSSPAACLILDEAMTIVRQKLPDAKVPPLDCRYETVLPPTSAALEEYDLFRLLNIFEPPLRVPYPRTVPVVETVPASERLDTLCVGSSFGMKMLAELERNHVLGRLLFFYYNRTMIEWGLPTPFAPVPPSTSPEWRRIVLDKTVFLMPLPEDYLPSNLGDFLVQIAEAMGVDAGPEKDLLLNEAD